ncbi:MAG TPA: aldehyde dehydrogenase family protein, partial [Candidatus Limnocylindrales bacterium]
MTDTATRKPDARTADTPPTFRHFIGGEWIESHGGGTFESVNPADTRDVIGRFQQGTAADVALAVRAAEQAFPVWRAMPAPKRGEILYRFGQLMAENKERLARA